MKLRELFDQELDELIGVKKYKDLTARQIMKKMEDELGLKKLGSGAFGDVMQSPDPNWVYKVLEKDPAYEEYIDFIAKNPNKHYPKIKRVKKMTSFFKRYQVQESKFTVIVIEKLEPIPQERIDFAVDLVNSDVDDIPSHNPDGDENYSGLTLEELMSHDWEEWTSEDMWSTYYAARTLRKSELKRSGTFMDLHKNNIMQRADGTIVLIDPVASYEGLDYGSSVSDARMSRQPMVKGPHYKPELAKAGPDDDPYDPWNPHPPSTSAWIRDIPSWDQERPSQWGSPQAPYVPKSRGRGITDRAFDELEDLAAITNPNAREVARMNYLQKVIDQQLDKHNEKEINPPAKKPINSTAEARAEFDKIMNKSYKTTADLNRAHELNAYLEKEWNGGN